MICISVTPESRTLGKVDILNAAGQGDIIELCLDRLIKEPDIKELLSVTSKPIIVSCRSREQGGQWEGTEAERLMLLRQAIVAGPAYIELDLDIASQVPRFGRTQRVISFTRLDQPETDIDGVFDAAAQAQADVVKFTWPTPTLDDAWPLLRAVSQKRATPIVGIGLGRGELTFSLLGRKFGSPWVYAALEKGMETFPGQATVFELDELYHFRDIDRSTTFIAIAGFGPTQQAATRLFNTAFKQQGMNVRCLPLVIGDVASLKKRLELLKIRAVMVEGGFGRSLLPLAEHLDPVDRQSGAVDLLLHRDDGWHGHNMLWRAGLRALEEKLGKPDGGGLPLERRSLLVLGNGGVAQSFAFAAQHRKGLVSLCGPNDKETQQTARELDARYIPFQNLYDTLADVVVIADPTLRMGVSHGCVNPSVLRPMMTVLDVSEPPVEHDLFQEARTRGCKLVPPAQVFRDRVAAQYRAIVGKDLPPDAGEAAAAES